MCLINTGCLFNYRAVFLQNKKHKQMPLQM